MKLPAALVSPPLSIFRHALAGTALALTVLGLSAAGTRDARAEALLLVEADSGKVLHAENATYPWYPASVTKVMTAYVILKAAKERRISLDQLFTVSPIAAAQQPSKMGFKIGTQITADNALKMLMVKSANDMAVVLAEGLSGSVENFADEMNRAARRLGMTQTNYVNPNGLPAENQITSARDLAILARAIIRELPEYDSYFNLPAIKFGRRLMRNYNTLIGRYPGADGMKTGFICASGFNLVATATRDNKRLIAVVLGAPSGPVRAVKAAQLFERGFNGGGLSWLTPALGTVDTLAPVAAAPPNMREEMCGRHRKRPAAEELDEAEATSAEATVSLFAAQSSTRKPSELLGPPQAIVSPVVVYVGPKRAPGAMVAAESDEDALEKPKGKAKKGKKGKAAKQAKSDKPASDKKTADTKPTDKKSGTAKTADKKNPDAKPGPKKDAEKKPKAGQPAAKPGDGTKKQSSAAQPKQQ